MPRHLTKLRLARAVVGAMTAMILSVAAIFSAAYHLAG